jgi:hypothetical protein
MKSFTFVALALISNASASKVKGWVTVDLEG